MSVHFLLRNFKYPFAFRWVLLSFILFFSSFVFACVISFDQLNLFLLFLFLTSLQVSLFTLVKYRRYRVMDKTGDNPLMPFFDGGSENDGSLSLILLIIFVFFGFSLPFLLLLLLDPFVWFISLLSFVAGINFPEIILYLLYIHAHGK